MLQSLPSDLSLLPYLEFIVLILPINEAPWKNLSPTPLAFGKRGGVFVQDPEAAPPVPVLEVVLQAFTSPRVNHTAMKGSGALKFPLRKNYVKHLRDVFRLTERQPIPLHLRLRPMHMPSVRRHQSLSKF